MVLLSFLQEMVVNSMSAAKHAIVVGLMGQRFNVKDVTKYTLLFWQMQDFTRVDMHKPLAAFLLLHNKGFI